MAEPQRTTVYLDPELHRALRLKAAETDSNVSALVNQAVRAALADDLEDLQALEDRKAEPSRRFEEFLRDLRDDGLL
ncbi:ribbon-helix-helix protein, CopG family [Myxococcota bacterium]|nr:ribbon-helix-helix protein, CopG family [Myxococcota bacterium]